MPSRGRALKLVPWILVVVAMSACASSSSGQQQMPAQTLACMPDPSACGYPDLESTGVTPGIPLTPLSGVVNLATPGQVLENAQVTGQINVTAQNVTIRNVKLIMTDENYGVEVRPGGDWNRADANLTLDHVEINMNGQLNAKGIAFSGYTVKNTFFHNGADCAHFGNNITIQDSLCVLGPDANNDAVPDSNGFCSGPAHIDGYQFDGGGNLAIRHNTVRNPCGQTSALLISDYPNTTTGDIIVDNNLIAGGGYTLYCPNYAEGNAVITNNVFAKTYFPKSGAYGPTTFCDHADVFTGNVFDGTQTPVAPAHGGSGSSGSAPTTQAPAASSKAVLLLSGPRASRITRSALKRELGRRYTRRAKGMRIKCHRSSKSTIACSVKWRSRPGGHGSRHRYSGTVTVKRVAVGSWRYTVRVRSWSSGCNCSVPIRRTRTI